MDRNNFCGLREPDGYEEYQRPRTALWWVADSLPSLTRDQVRRAVQAAFDSWSAVANVSASEAGSAAEADLLVNAAQIDGRAGVLADCELPAGQKPQHMRLDQAERWVVQLGRIGGDVIDLERVLRHELGHFWGLLHDSPDSGALMAPTYSLTVDAPTQRDAQRMQQIYGPPAAPKPTTPGPGGVDPPDQLWIVGQSGNVTAKFKLTRI